MRCKNTDDFDGLAASATHLPTETGTRHTPNYVVHFQRNLF